MIADLPGVGDDLNDHYFARIILRCREPITLNDAARNWLLGAKAVADYALFRRGYFAIPAISAGCFIKAHPSSETPDIQCSIALYSIHNLGDCVDPFSGFTITATLLRPESRGHVRIKSADPRQAPAIHPNYLATRKDRDTLLAGVKALRRMAKAPALARHIVEEVDPGPACDERRRACSTSSAAAARPSITRSAPAAWARTPRRWSTSGSRCAASSGCG